MKLTLHSGDLGAATDLLAIGLFEGELATHPAVKLADRGLGGQLLAAAKEQAFKGDAKQQLVLHTLGKLSAKRVALFGLGKPSAPPASLLHFGGACVRIGNDTGAKRLIVALPVGIKDA